MCLLVLAWNAHPRYRLILAANRDEFHARPATAMHWWEEPSMLAGRDLEAGGTWLGVTREGRFGVVTNYRDMQRPAPGALSRGRLIPEFLGTNVSVADFASRLTLERDQYSGFNLLVGDAAELSYITNRGTTPARALAAGVYGLSNHLLDTPWPKLVRARTEFERLLNDDMLEPDRLFEILTDRVPSQDQVLPESGLPPELERALSAPFVVSERFGTRCSTVLLISRDGGIEIAEQSYDSRGLIIGRVSFNVPKG
jgi:uncharacterized protein with NRDE domain